jgi:DNA replication and repair protein RecF
MIVKSIDLKNYRNYDIMSMNFSDKTNIIYGDNAQGKTNILEAMCVCATSKSHRGSKDREIIQFGSDEAHIKMVVERGGLDYRVDMHLKKNRHKGIAVNGVPLRKALDLFGIVNIVFFSPEDLNIIKDGPAERRRFMDMELSQLDKIYVHNIVSYNKVLLQRNKLLKDIAFGVGDKDTLDVWDIQLERYGKQVISIRKDFVGKLNEIVTRIHSNLSGGSERLEIEYVPNSGEDAFAMDISTSRDRDLKLGTTNCGPHKDDLVFYINGNDVRKYGSQGQQRTAALSLKLAEIEFVRQIIGENPVLLLDDVLSELDSKRQQFLVDSMGDIQTIVTCTGIEEFINRQLNVSKTYKVVAGQIYPM